MSLAQAKRRAGTDVGHSREVQRLMWDDPACHRSRKNGGATAAAVEAAVTRRSSVDDMALSPSLANGAGDSGGLRGGLATG